MFVFSEFEIFSDFYAVLFLCLGGEKNRGSAVEFECGVSSSGMTFSSFSVFFSLMIFFGS